MKTTRLLLAAVCLFATTFAYAQQQIWSAATSTDTENHSLAERAKIPNTFKLFKIDLPALKAAVENAPVRWIDNHKKPVLVAFPNADGVFQNYRVYEAPIMEPKLALKFPDIKSYVAQGIDDQTAYMRFTITSFGLHTMVLSGNQPTFYSDPYTVDQSYQIVYTKKALGQDPQSFDCLTDQNVKLPSLSGSTTNTQRAVDDQKFRTFRLAQSCTAEYGNLFANAGTEVADIQAQMAISIARVNSIYEIDLGLTLIFIANNDQLIYYGDANNDPWTNEWNNTTQATIDAAIADGDYDIGHNFNTGGGGNAGCIGCVCVSGEKGSGYTGASNPTGDPFDVDYVAHEMGHQFGGYHTMNTCSRSGSGNTEVEPASGSSIMSYAGICGTNVQNQVDAHLAYVNVRDITDNYMNGQSTCAALATTTNNPPTASAGNDYNIPKGTAFVLEGTATDADGTGSLTYNWAQNDPEQGGGNGSPSSNWTSGPLYRTYAPGASPTRWMPKLSDVIAGNLYPTWEVTPDVARTMNFSFMVRDNDASGPQTADDLMAVNVDGSAGPFRVTSQGAAVSWSAGATETITWDVANSDGGSVNCPNVDIFLSTDGGYTYPVTIATNVANNGTYNITVPSNPTTTGRIMVRGANNIFYAINGRDITIESAEFVLSATPTSTDVCPGSDATFDLTYNTFLGFAETTNLSVAGEPAGSTTSFTSSSVSTDGETSTLTISGITNAMIGTYAITITGTATSVTKTTVVTLNVLDDSPAQTTLLTPNFAATGINVATSLTWSAVAGSGILYNIEIATDAGFSNIVESNGAVSGTSYSTSSLLASTQYYWRVTSYNSCGTGATSATFYFTTSTCATVASADVPVVIPEVGPDSIFSTIDITALGTVNDVNVLQLIGTHTWVSDLTIVLRSPAGTRVILMDQICNNKDDFDVNYDDAAATANLPCPPVGGGNYIPVEALSAFNGETAAGTWTLIVIDNENQDGGSLDAWSLEICTDPPVCVDPELPVLSGTTTICDGETTVLSAAGNLNSATDWQWYTSSCGGTSIGTGTSVSVTASTNTTYFVRGEGACVVPGACENIEVLVNPAYNLTETVEICDGSTHTYPDGSTGTTAGTYVSSFTTTQGCDSTIATTLIVNPVYNITVNAQICNGATYTFPDGSTSNVATTQVSSLSSVSSCDSIITTVLTEVGQFIANVQATPCEGTTYTYPDGSTTTTDGTNTSNFTSLLGCDSIINTTVTFQQPFNSTITASICDGETYTFPDGSTSSTAVVQVSNMATIYGCDSIITTDLTVNPSYDLQETITLCEGETYTYPDGSIGDVTETHMSNLSTTLNCDSIITTSLIINPSHLDTVYANICDGSTYTYPDGNTSSVTEEYLSTFTSSLNCDSSILTILTVNETYNETTSVDICDGEVYTFPDGTVSSTNMTQTSTLTSVNSCDSIIVTTLTVTSIDATITAVGQTLTASQSAATYQWVDCSDGSNIPNETNQSFTSQVTGDFSVITSLNNCEETSECYHLTGTGIAASTNNEPLLAYPNPTSDVLKIVAPGPGTIVITDVLGKTIAESLVTAGTSTFNDLLQQASGVYFITYFNKTGETQRIRLIKK